MSPRSVLLLAASLACQQLMSQFVTLEGRKFMLNGQEFYPRVMNYGIQFTNNSYGTAIGLYPTANGAYDYYVAGEFECIDAGDCLGQLERHFEKIVSMGFNTIRLLAAVRMRMEDGSRKFSLQVQQNIPDEGNDVNFTLDLNPPYFDNDASYFYFEGLRSVLHLADQEGLKVILLACDDSGWSAADNWYAVHDYSRFLRRLGSELREEPALLAYDLWNEPTWTYNGTVGIGFNQWLKSDVCTISAEWYDALKGTPEEPNDTNHLVTIGSASWDDLEWFDPNVMKLDFVSMHFYPDQYSVGGYNLVEMYNRIKAKIYWNAVGCPMPYIIGETSFSAEDSNDDNFDDANNQHLVDDDIYDAPPWRDGREEDQRDYAELTMNATRLYWGSGYSWWDFQNNRMANLTPPSPSTSEAIDRWHIWYRNDFYGVLRYGDRDLQPPLSWEDKMVVDLFENYTLPTIPSQLPSPPPTYYNGRFNGIHGSGTPIDDVDLVDQNGDPIGHAVAYEKVHYRNDQLEEVFAIENWLTSYPDGSLIIPEGPTWPFTQEEAFRTEFRVHVPGGKTRRFDNLVDVPDELLLHRQVLTFSKDVHDVIIEVDQAAYYWAWSQIECWNTVFEGSGGNGATSTLRARDMIHISDESHAQFGSDVHIYCEPVWPNCESPEMDAMVLGPAEQSPPPIEKSSSVNSNIELRFQQPSDDFRSQAMPNPCSTYVNLTVSKPEGEFELLDANGTLVARARIFSSVTRIDMTPYPSGVYQLVVRTGSEMERHSITKSY